MTPTAQNKMHNFATKFRLFKRIYSFISIEFLWGFSFYGSIVKFKQTAQQVDTMMTITLRL